MSPALTQANMAARAHRVGASEVAALLPCGHPFLTAGDVYARVVHGVRRPETEAMRMGHALEPVALRLGAARLGMAFRRTSRTWVHPTLPLAATPDAVRIGARELGEVKAVSHWAADDWQDGPPAYVRAQAQAQMLVCRRDAVHVIALFDGSRVATWTLPADPAEQDRIADAVREFERHHLIPLRPPDDVPGELVLTVASLEGSVAADGDLLAYGDALAGLMVREAAATKAKDEARGAMALGMAAVGAALVRGPSWVAETFVVEGTGRTSLRFSRDRGGRS